MRAAILGVLITAAAIAIPRFCRPADRSDLNEFTHFLYDYRAALINRDESFLKAHTQFPLHITAIDLDMEAKPVLHMARSISDLLRWRELVAWPVSLSPSEKFLLETIQRGAEKCDDAVHPDVPDWTKGGPAFSYDSDGASMRYLNEPCAAETHVVTLKFKRTSTDWQLVDRSIKLGAE